MTRDNRNIFLYSDGEGGSKVKKVWLIDRLIVILLKESPIKSVK
jgi:hypothetical protein